MPVPEALLETRALVKRFGGLTATKAVSLSVAAGELHAIIGPNGAGKTTLIAELAGEIAPDGGRIFLAGADISALGVAERAAIGIARSYQITSIFREFSVLDNVALAVQAHAGHSFRFWAKARHDPRLRDPARTILSDVGLAQRAELPAAALSHGEKRALEIAIALATRPRLLLLDEPMAGMGPQDAAGMMRLLATLKRKMTIVLVEHDMDAVFALADRISVLVYGRVLATGAPAEIRADAKVRRAYLGEEA